MIVWLRLVALPHTSVAVHVAVFVCRQLVPVARKLETTLKLLQSLNTGALNTSVVPHWLVASLPCGAVTVGAVVSTRMIVWLRLVALPHASLAVHVIVLVCRQLVPVVTRLELTLTLLQLSANTGALKLNAVPH
jgi:hypothetical protein